MSDFVAPNLLNDDGTASMATMFLMSHHAFRRDLARFAKALETIGRGDTSRAAAVAEEWKFWRGALHGHHQMEDANIFPSFRSAQPSLAPLIDRLSAEHHQIDPLLERGDRAFQELPNVGPAVKVIAELRELLTAHLAAEETGVVPLLRAAKVFPPPPSDAEAAMYADGFAWSMHGVASGVIECVQGMLPPAITSNLDAARARYDARCERAWGSAHAGASRTSVPEE